LLKIIIIVNNVKPAETVISNQLGPKLAMTIPAKNSDNGTKPSLPTLITL